MHRFPWILSALAAGCIGTPAAAQSYTGLEAFSQVMLQACREAVPTLSQRPEYQLLLQDAPVDVAAVCACTGKQLSSDARLREIMVGDLQAVALQLQSPRLRAYASMRFATGMFGCLSAAMGESLGRVTLP